MGGRTCECAFIFLLPYSMCEISLFLKKHIAVPVFFRTFALLLAAERSENDKQMRRLFYCSISMIILAVACNQDCRIDALYELNDLVKTNPDSALSILQDMEQQPQFNEAPEEFKAYHSLLQVKAMDKTQKLSKMPQSDSLIRIAVEYFEQYPQSGFLAETYYYAGRVCSEHHNGDKALLYYNKALLKDSTHVSTHLKSRIYAQMGLIYLRNELYSEALQMEDLARFYCQEDSDTLGMRLCTETIVDISRMEMEKDSDANSDQTKLAIARVQRLNEQVKSDMLHNKNTQLLAENAKRNKIIFIVVVIAVILIAVATVLAIRIRKQAIERKKLYEEMGTLNAVKRQFYDKELDKLLISHDRNGEMLRAKDWTVIEERLDESFPNFRERLYSSYNFSEQEYRICVLIKMGVSPSMMSTLLATSKSNITQSRQRMQQKVFNGRGSAKDWDRFILSL